MATTPQIISYPQASGTPKTGGKVFFVSDASGALWNAWNLTYQPDYDGISRVYTTVALALAQTVAARGDYVELAPDFTTAVSAADLLTAETNGVTVLQNGKAVGTRWFAERATANLPQSVSAAIFTVTGKVRIREIVGTVTQIVQAQDTPARFDAVPTSANLSSVALAAFGSIKGLVTDGLLTITGTLSAKLVSTSNAAVIDQAAAVVMTAGSIRFKTTASSTGKVKFRVEYEPMEAGARIFAA